MILAGQELLLDVSLDKGGLYLWPNDAIHVRVSINGVPPNGWCLMENPIEVDDLGVPPFQETFM